MFRDEVLSNPSFESGDLSPWAVDSDYGSATIVSDSSDDGAYAVSLGYELGGLGAIYQTVDDLVVGDTYTASYDYKIESAKFPSSCVFFLAIDGIIQKERLTMKALSYTASGTSWNTTSSSFTATSTSHGLFIFVECTDAMSSVPVVYVDNAKFIASTEDAYVTSCITSTFMSTVTSAPSSSAFASSVISSGQLTSPSLISPPNLIDISKSIVSRPFSITTAASSPAMPYTASPSTNPNPTVSSAVKSSSHVMSSRSFVSSILLPKSSSPSHSNFVSSPTHSEAATSPSFTASALSTSLSRHAQSSQLSKSSKPAQLPPLSHLTFSTAGRLLPSIPSNRTFSHLPSSSIAVFPTTASTHTPTPIKSQEPHYTTSEPSTTSIVFNPLTISVPDNSPSTSTPEYTASSIFTTQTATITACPSSVKECPAASKTTYLTTETIILSTTVCPVSEIPNQIMTHDPNPSDVSGTGTKTFYWLEEIEPVTVYSTSTVFFDACPTSH
ncbi:hypothetical protein BO71DRAFT_484075 [Aspergillus ellipticus CBS 707.79]|uniref:CBM-cenC domain-containing protein n=1 Tax=Aspergillus ellipticus CBS 707.79 TaxID=1448320 RepID=A0A319DA13_9EURO|nr:hypothetical protein BO71DRAFT_484075 [Aspergillus ellipticus CBS 707.79]